MLAADGNRAVVTITEAAKMGRNDATAIVTATESVDSIGKVAADRVVSKVMIVAAVAAAGTGDRVTVTVEAAGRNVAQDEVIDAFKIRYISYILDKQY